LLMDHRLWGFLPFKESCNRHLQGVWRRPGLNQSDCRLRLLAHAAGCSSAD
jgi:hypothetical protein